MRNGRTNARRRAARRFIKNHTMSMAKWFVNMINADETLYLNNFLFDMSYKTYVDLQNSIRNPQDRHKLKAWYYSGYDVNTRPPEVIVYMLYFNLRRQIGLSRPLMSIPAEDIYPETVKTLIDLHLEPKYIIEAKPDKA